MNLLVDLGNSRLKWAVDGADGWSTGALAWPGSQGLDTLFDIAWGVLEAPSQVLACSVAGHEREVGLGAWMQRRWRRAPTFVHASACWNGLRNSYVQPERLGPDRWAALIGARAEFHGDVCIVDCGTATTVDGLRADGQFIGGVIFAGLSLSRTALFTRTATLRPQTGNGGSVAALNTHDAIAVGTLHAAAGAVDRLIDDMARLLDPTAVGRITVVLCGGDAEVMIPLLRHEVVYRPDLVLRGLAHMAGEAR